MTGKIDKPTIRSKDELIERLRDVHAETYSSRSHGYQVKVVRGELEELVEELLGAQLVFVEHEKADLPVDPGPTEELELTDPLVNEDPDRTLAPKPPLRGRRGNR